ncbi:MAG: Flp pilus assembly protein CpaB [Pseudonocardiales bacterium]
MGRRTLLLLAALLVAAVGTVLVFLYASTANARALRGQNPVEVLVAKTQISVGTSAAQAAEKGMLDQKTITRAAAAPGALGPAALSTLNGKVALSTIYPGEQILAVKFGSQAQTSVLPLPPGMVAASVQVADPARVAGFVTPGSSVGVFVTLSPSGGATRGGTATFTQLLLPKAQVIAVGATAGGSAVTDGQTDGKTAAGANPEQQLPRALLTLALNQQDAAKLVFASQQGQVYFVLLSPTATLTPGTAVTLQNLFR